MSERRIITFEQFKAQCKYSDCEDGIPDACWMDCESAKCPIWERFPDAEPIIEAAKLYHRGTSSETGYYQKLKAALDALEGGK